MSNFGRKQQSFQKQCVARGNRRSPLIKPGFRYPIGFFLLSTLFLFFSILSSAHASDFSSMGGTLAQGKKLFQQNCVGCHGATAEGTDKGPALISRRDLRARSVKQLHALIRSGIPGGGMPAFALPSPELNALATFIHSLNSSAAETHVPGDADAGRKYFFGEGRCSSCHMVYGKGSPAGPDLSDVGSQMTLSGIEKALLTPSKSTTPGYKFVEVQLTDGQILRGFERNRSNFGIVVQDLDGHFHILQSSQYVAVRKDAQQIMPPFKGSPAERQNLLAFLSGLTGVKPGKTYASDKPEKAGISFSRILNPKPGDWPTYNGNLSGNRYSKLDQINTTDVNKLVLKWSFSIPYDGLETTPVVVDGVMYVTGPNQADAISARTGQLIWHYERPRTPGLWGDGRLGTNRGVAVLGDKVFMVTDNAHLIALNRTTGRLVWETRMPDKTMHYGATSAPLVVRNLVISGVSGADEGIRGFVAAYKASNGQRVWRHWTVPQKGQPAAKTWGPNSKDMTMGGGSTWLTGTYDPETDTLFWPTGNPFPDGDGRNRPGDDLYTDCILALDPASGRMKWYYQFTPHDLRDWDATEPPVLVDTKYRGRERKLLLHADRNGFFYVLDRTNGKLLLGKPFVKRLNWARGIGPDGRPELLPAYYPPPQGALSCPGSATNWMSTAFSPITRLYYVMALESCYFKSGPGHWTMKHPHIKPAQKFLRALNIETGKIMWQVPEIGPAEGKQWAGVLATAGGLIFYGDPSGNVVAADERNGQPLWHFPTNHRMKSSPMTYMLGGKQYVSLAVGSNILSFGLP